MVNSITWWLCTPRLGLGPGWEGNYIREQSQWESKACNLIVCNQKPDQPSKAFLYSINSQKFADFAGAKPGLSLQAEEYPPSHHNGGKLVLQSPWSSLGSCDSAGLASLPHSSLGSAAEAPAALELSKCPHGCCSLWAAAAPNPSRIEPRAAPQRLKVKPEPGSKYCLDPSLPPLGFVKPLDHSEIPPSQAGSTSRPPANVSPGRAAE